jgi:hypothetical protein
MSTDGLKKEFVSKYLAVGEQKFYRFLLVYALNKLVLLDKNVSVDPTPDLEFLDYHDRFIILYRREGEEVYLRLARLFRKAAHKIYRIMLKKGMTPPNAKFLNLV